MIKNLKFFSMLFLFSIMCCNTFKMVNVSKIQWVFLTKESKTADFFMSKIDSKSDVFSRSLNILTFYQTVFHSFFLFSFSFIKPQDLLHFFSFFFFKNLYYLLNIANYCCYLNTYKLIAISLILNLSFCRFLFISISNSSFTIEVY